VEAALARHPAVQDAAVVPTQDAAGARLVAYVVVKPGSDSGLDALRAHVAGLLPDHMVPSAVVPLEALPRTPSGKIDRLALPEADTRAVSTKAYVAPSTTEEEAVARVWAEVLGVERVGVLDDFFDLGGHSLLATQVIARTRNELGVQLPLNVFFTDPTVRGLASAVAGHGAGGSADELSRLLDDLESLSDEEAEQLLASERDGLSEGP
jgi:acyl carrier protein